MGISPVAAGRVGRDCGSGRWALGVALVTSLLLPLVFGGWSPLIAFGLFLSLWIVAATVSLVVQRFRHAPQGSFAAKVASNSAAWDGMVVAHLGIAVFIAGVTLVNGYSVEQNLTMDNGQSVSVGGYDFTFRGVTPVSGPNYTGVAGVVEMRRSGVVLDTLRPEKRIYNASGSQMTEAAIDTGFFGDRYVSLGEPVSDKGIAGAWALRIYIKPFVDWIWGGCFMMALGGFLAITDRRYRLAVKQKLADLTGTAAA
jgi:cytochrome c-type biogenesis protein CcmF